MLLPACPVVIGARCGYNRTMPDYAAHDEAYRRLRAEEERTGWDDTVQQQRDEDLLDRLAAWPEFPARAGRLLEIGCGAGNAALWFARRGWTVSGVDISALAIDWARENATAAGVPPAFDVGNVLTLDTVADASMDLVLDGHCLHCIIGGDRAQVLAAVRRVLKPRGALLVRSMCNDPPRGSPLRASWDPKTRFLMRGGEPVRYIGLAVAIMAELRDAGFSISRSEVIPACDENDVDELLAIARKPA